MTTMAQPWPKDLGKTSPAVTISHVIILASNALKYNVHAIAEPEP